MPPEFEKATIDLANPDYAAGLENALNGSPLFSTAWLADLEGNRQLFAESGQSIREASSGAQVKFARQLFGLESASDWEADMRPGPVRAISLCRQTILSREAENMLLRICPDLDNRALLITVSNTLPAGDAVALSRRLAAGATSENLDGLLSSAGDVLAGALLNTENGEWLNLYRRADNASQIQLQAELGQAIAEVFRETLPAGTASLVQAAERAMQQVTIVDLECGSELLSVARVPMVPVHVLGIRASSGVDADLLRRTQRDSLNDVLRQSIGALLEDGLETQLVPFPTTETEFQDIVSELRALDDNDLIARLDIGGFAPHGFGEGEDFQQCKECIYYLPNRKWCDIPELPLPVEAHWWCRLWKL